MVDDVRNRITNNNLYDKYVNHFNSGHIESVKIYKIYIYNERNQVKEHEIYWFDVYKDDIKKIYKDVNKINNLWNKLLFNALITCGSVYAKDENFYDYDEYHNYVTNELYDNNEELKREIIMEFEE